MTDKTNELLMEIETKLNAVSPSMCLAKWLQSSILLQTGQTHSCHHPKTHKVPLRELRKNPGALHNTKYKKVMRAQMLSGERPKECDYCWKMENLSARSDRIYKSSAIWAAPYLEEVLRSGATENINPKYLEVSFDNLCNFKCAYCSPRSSSSWYSEIKNLGEYPTSNRFGHLEKGRYNSPLILDKENNPYSEAFQEWWPKISKDLRVFRITGGEPLLHKSTWQVLDHIIDNPNVELELAINSNLGIPTELVEKLCVKINQLQGKIKSFILFASIDTIGTQAEYIRFGLNEELFWKNSEFYLNNTNWPSELAYMLTVNGLSLPGMESLYRKIFSQRESHSNKKINIDPSYLRYPNFLAVNIFPKVDARYIDKTIDFIKMNQNNYPSFHQEDLAKLDRIRSWMLESELSDFHLGLAQKDFYLFIREYDKRRGTDFLQIFPEYKEFYNACKRICEFWDGE